MGVGQNNGTDSVISSGIWAVLKNKVALKFRYLPLLYFVSCYFHGKKIYICMLLQTYITDLRDFSDIWAFPLNIETPELCLTFYG